LNLLSVIGRRLLQIVVTVVVVAVLVFFLMRLLPGDPAMVLAGERASDEALARARLEMRLDDPLLLQFWEFLLRTMTLRFGQSVTMRVSVTSLIIERLPVTMMLTGMACFLALAMAVPLAFIAALKRGSWADAAIRLFAQLSVSMPVFYIGLVLLITLAAGLRWFPVGGIGGSFTENIYYLFLPALTLALSLAAILLRNLREALIEVLHAEYVEFATAKGLPARLILRRHVLRNAWVSTVTLLGLHIGTLVGGAVITETVFAIPGIGRLMIDSIFARDYAVVQGLTMVLAIMVSVVFLALDTVQAILDPRVAG
jgi:peptide/nickel transport system permease protein